MNSIHTEATFETAIIEGLSSNGWFEGHSTDYNKDLAFDKKAAPALLLLQARNFIFAVYPFNANINYYICS